MNRSRSFAVLFDKLSQIEWQSRPKYKSAVCKCFIGRTLHVPNLIIRFGTCKVQLRNTYPLVREFDINLPLTLLMNCLDTRQPGTVFKNLDTRQSEILTSFLDVAWLIPLRKEDICLEISSHRKYCLGLKVEATVEFGRRVID